MPKKIVIIALFVAVLVVFVGYLASLPPSPPKRAIAAVLKHPQIQGRKSQFKVVLKSIALVDMVNAKVKNYPPEDSGALFSTIETQGGAYQIVGFCVPGFLENDQYYKLEFFVRPSKFDNEHIIAWVDTQSFDVYCIYNNRDLIDLYWGPIPNPPWK